MADKFVDINGVKICYQVQGEGHPLVLLHGFAMYKEFWKWHTKELSKDLIVLTMDIRGCGNSEHPTEQFSMELLADDVKESASRSLSLSVIIKENECTPTSGIGMVAYQSPEANDA